MSNKRLFTWEQAASLWNKYKHTQVVLLLMLMAAAYRLLHYQYQLRVPCSQGMCTAQQSAEGQHQSTTLHRKGLHLLRWVLMWSINSLVDDGLPDRIPTGLPKSLLPLAVVLAIHDINISHAQMADNTLSLQLSLLNQFSAYSNCISPWSSHPPTMKLYCNELSWKQNHGQILPILSACCCNIPTGRLQSCLPYIHD